MWFGSFLFLYLFSQRIGLPIFLFSSTEKYLHKYPGPLLPSGSCLGYTILRLSENFPLLQLEKNNLKCVGSWGWTQVKHYLKIDVLRYRIAYFFLLCLNLLNSGQFDLFKELRERRKSLNFLIIQPSPARWCLLRRKQKLFFIKGKRINYVIVKAYTFSYVKASSEQREEFLLRGHDHILIRIIQMINVLFSYRDTRY